MMTLTETLDEGIGIAPKWMRRHRTTLDMKGHLLDFMRLARLDFLPRSTDCGMLLLRVWLGLSILLLHGKGKLTGFSEMSAKFSDPLGVGSTTSLALAVFAEVVCAALLVVGLFTRFAAAVLAFTMGVAFFMVHQGALSGGKSGEMAFIYLAGFVAIFLAGGGRFSIDAKLGVARNPPPAP